MLSRDLDSGEALALNAIARVVHLNSKDKGFWEGQQNHAEKIALMHSELSEALEALRTDRFADDPKVPAITNFEAELADVLIRVLDYCVGNHIDIGRAVMLKHNYNRTRPYKHGKQF